MREEPAADDRARSTSATRPTTTSPRADLGALRIPVGAGLDLQVEVNEAAAGRLGDAGSRPDGTMQLGLFAAPRNEGIWDEVRAEIAESLTQQRGKPAEREDGAFGTELTGDAPGEGGRRMPVRFIGIDGPRWFLRAMLVGAAADPGAGRGVRGGAAPGRRGPRHRPAAGARTGAAARCRRTSRRPTASTDESGDESADAAGDATRLTRLPWTRG